MKTKVMASGLMEQVQDQSASSAATMFTPFTSNTIHPWTLSRCPWGQIGLGHVFIAKNATAACSSL